jgi:hypothetical protein
MIDKALPLPPLSLIAVIRKPKDAEAHENLRVPVTSPRQ